MTVTERGTDVVGLVAKVARTSVHAADVLVEFGLYEALCDEVDRIDDQLQADVADWIVKRAADAFPALTRAYTVAKAAGEDTAAHGALAGILGQLVAKSTDDDPTTWRWDARDDSGRFRPADALRILAGGRNPKRNAEDARTVLNRRGYEHATTLGNALSIAGQGQAGAALRLVGDIGQEAQTALEPGIRRTAYRYRGTERRPSAQTQKDAAILSLGVQNKPLPDAYEADFDGWTHEALSPGSAAISPEAGALLAGSKRDTSDQRRLKVLSAYGALKLVPRLPNKERAQISLAAGKLPPSVGLMFDAKGQLVSEAQGFNGDHYLPFDLKNLKRLRGGSYVRTRTSGGLTDEDIYTGLMTGARRVTVVSNSGVYSLEFDPDLKGGRRYSDKARQMVDRYARLTGAIGSKKLYQNDVPKEQLDTLRREALKDAGGNAEAAGTLVHQRLPQLQARLAFTAMSDEDIDTQAEAAVRAYPNKPQGAQYAQAIRHEAGKIRADQAKQGVRAYRLDHEGYTAALDSLAQEFPFYVRSVQHEPLQDYLEAHRAVDPGTPRRPRGGSDLGYTPRGELKPNRAGELGAPAPRQARRAAGATVEGDAPQRRAGEQQAAAPAAAATGFDAKLADARKAMVVGLSNSMHYSLRAVNDVDSPDWGDPIAAGSPKSEAIVQPPIVYTRWLFHEKHGASGVAKYLAEEADNDEIDKVITAAKEAKRVIARDPDLVNFKAESFDEVVSQLGALKVLKQPWSKGPDDLSRPPAIPEITALDTPEKLAEYGRQNPDIAEAASKLDLDNAELGQRLAELRKRNDALRAWKGEGDPPPGSGLKEEDRGLAEGIAANPEHPNLKAEQTAEQAWALAQMHRLVGAIQGGGAVPFVKADSRIVRHGPDSPLAKRLSSRRHARR